MKKIYKEFCYYNDGAYIMLDIDPEKATKEEMINRAKEYLKRQGFNEQDIKKELTHCYVISYSKNILEEC
jgi:hypothetical protein